MPSTISARPSPAAHSAAQARSWTVFDPHPVCHRRQCRRQPPGPCRRRSPQGAAPAGADGAGKPAASPTSARDGGGDRNRRDHRAPGRLTKLLITWLAGQSTCSMLTSMYQLINGKANATVLWTHRSFEFMQPKRLSSRADKRDFGWSARDEILFEMAQRCDCHPPMQTTKDRIRRSVDDHATITVVSRRARC